jgi:HEAT repeat protein
VEARNPAGGLAELLRIHRYESGDTRGLTDHLLRYAFVEDLDITDFRILFPLLRGELQQTDAFVKKLVLLYFQRCGLQAKAAIPDITQLLHDPDPQVRTAATNALNAIAGVQP